MGERLDNSNLTTVHKAPVQFQFLGYTTLKPEYWEREAEI